MLRHVAATALALALACPAGPGFAASEAQELVDKSRLTAEKMLAHPDFPSLRVWMKQAKGVFIVPSLLKAGFLIGGEGGSGVVLARDAKGGWSYPAFYATGAGSIGLQIGFQDSEVMFVIMTQKGLDAILSSRFKLGADASIALGPVGAGVEGATTAGLGADIYAFGLNRGLFGGVSLEGAVIWEREDWNAQYYGPGATSGSVLLEHKFANRAADDLRRAVVVP